MKSMILSWRNVKTTMKFRIAKQSHRRGTFGNCEQSLFAHESWWGKKYCYLASNGIQLISVSGPQWIPEDNTLFVRGLTPDMDDNMITVNLADFHRIYQAVIEYNGILDAYGRLGVVRK